VDRPAVDEELLVPDLDDLISTAMQR